MITSKNFSENVELDRKNSTTYTIVGGGGCCDIVPLYLSGLPSLYTEDFVGKGGFPFVRKVLKKH